MEDMHIFAHKRTCSLTRAHTHTHTRRHNWNVLFVQLKGGGSKCGIGLRWSDIYLRQGGYVKAAIYLSVCHNSMTVCREMERIAKLKEERRGESLQLTVWRRSLLERTPSFLHALHICCMPGIARGLGKSHQLLCFLHMCLCGTGACEYNYWDQYQYWCIPHGEPGHSESYQSLIRSKDLLVEESSRSAILAGQMLTWHLKNNTAQLELS